MEVADLIPVVERFEDNLDDLEEVIKPLLARSLEETSKKLPLLERAKLHALVTYTVESLIYSYLRLRGVEAKEHPVFTELTRVKQYFRKIAALESEPEKTDKPTMRLDQGAARRFISHGLAGNEQYDNERAEKLAKERARAQLKAAMLAKQSKNKPSTSVSSQEPRESSTSASSSDSEAHSESESESESEDSEPEAQSQYVENNRKVQPSKEPQAPEDFIQLPSEPFVGLETAKSKAKKRKEAALARKADRKAKREGKPTNEASNNKQALDQKKERRRNKQAKKKAKRAKQKQKGNA
ncbi:hypothetical protein UA08_01984 [Talaromyces atroroseus]|uniref:Exosome complex protein n=1 Tax=Talaromyces atroroseus TaxID=1441469 RepID=A0A1Q5QBZ5_TALAT|nr:hypothetical protein UA08_01984 [Talaromyces atroroseus]OKL63440.1 hypothetical protein UA08_01984 [Talaromyces atroroseus]